MLSPFCLRTLASLCGALPDVAWTCHCIRVSTHNEYNKQIREIPVAAMTGFIQNMIWNSVEGFVEAGKRTAGGYAGDALIKVGDAIENGGRSVGTGLERKVSGYGTSISGQGYQGKSSSAPKKKPLPAPSRPSAPKRSNSSPAATPPANIKRIGPASSTPLGAKKIPSSVKPAQNALSNGVSSGKSTVGAGIGGAKSALGSTVKAASTTNLNKTAKSLPKPYPNNTSFGSASTHYSQAFPTEKKTAVKPGAPKPFQPPKDNSLAKKAVSPYPGTNTRPGEASRTPVRRKFKPMERAAPQAEHGKMQHIAI
ncbi:hypothetical protein DM02DRAFT_613162 [Periconia macrospinosa]|uniref:Uncharacterized protein n=1 Tax=Periconia macrospinosa TaxID=97972 RepID=A0A2V1DV26_9PLEO|nr:hypothetical protein DM02DRAFT_613162 [Periconia macrospinosa]